MSDPDADLWLRDGRMPLDIHLALTPALEPHGEQDGEPFAAVVTATATLRQESGRKHVMTLAAQTVPVSDLEEIVGRVAAGIASPFDLVIDKAIKEAWPQLHAQLAGAYDDELAEALDADIDEEEEDEEGEDEESEEGETASASPLAPAARPPISIIHQDQYGLPFNLFLHPGPDEDPRVTADAAKVLLDAIYKAHPPDNPRSPKSWRSGLTLVATLQEHISSQIQTFRDGIGSGRPAPNCDIEHFPIKDFGTPDPRRLIEWFEHLKMLEPANVFLSCRAGLGRTGTIAACMLRFFAHMDAKLAVAAIRKTDRRRVETAAQERFVSEFNALPR